MKLGTFPRAAFVLAGSLAAVAAMAQTSGQASGGQAGGAAPTGLNLPANSQFLVNRDPSIRTATAIVNGTIITGTDIDHRVALIALANQIPVPQDELERIRAQILRNLIDETLQIQAATQVEITIEPREIARYFCLLYTSPSPRD